MEQNADGWVGRVINERFRIERVLGRGGMGVVYLAVQESVGRRVAIKVLRPEAATDEVMVRRFRREVAIVAHLQHPNIVRLHDAGTTEDGHLYMVMEYLEGRTLARCIQADAPLPVDVSLRVAEQICAALAAAHEAGVVHRDLKPDNVIVAPTPTDPWFVKVVDFGIARLVEGASSTTTLTQALIGTPKCLAPEQIQGDPVDGRADLYALGVILYELLAGAPPFEGNVPQLILAHTMRPPPPMAQRRPGLAVPAEVERFVLEKLLAKEPALRPPDAAAAVRALRELRTRTRAMPAPTRLEQRPVAENPSTTTDPGRLQPAANAATLVEFVDGAIPLGSQRPWVLPPEQPPPPSPEHPQAARVGRRAYPWAVGAGVAFAALAGAFLLWFHGRGPNEPQRADRPPAANAVRAPTPTPVRASAPKPVLSCPDGFALIPAGTFVMGAQYGQARAEPDELPAHRVRLTHAFCLGKTEVTQRQWTSLMGTNPSFFRACGPRCPVERVSWFDAVAYANALSERRGLEPCYELRGCRGKPGQGTFRNPRTRNAWTFPPGGFRCAEVRFKGPDCEGYRLPTEAEWEYAARGPAGDTTSGQLTDVAWFRGNSIVSYEGGISCSKWLRATREVTCGTHPVAVKAPNGYGVYDMLGNVWEWVWDVYAPDFYETSPEADPQGPSFGSKRVLRGGSWTSGRAFIRWTNRASQDPGDRDGNNGFRLAVRPTAKPPDGPRH